MIAENQELTDIVQNERVPLFHRIVGAGAGLIALSSFYLGIKTLIADDVAPTLVFLGAGIYCTLVATYNLL